MVSYSKKRDREMRVLLMESMEIALRLGKIEYLKTFGVASAKMKQKIETHDYRKEDALLSTVMSLSAKNRGKIKI